MAGLPVAVLIAGGFIPTGILRKLRWFICYVETGNYVGGLGDATGFYFTFGIRALGGRVERQFAGGVFASAAWVGSFVGNGGRWRLGGEPAGAAAMAVAGFVCGDDGGRGHLRGGGSGLAVGGGNDFGVGGSFSGADLRAEVAGRAVEFGHRRVLRVFPWVRAWAGDAEHDEPLDVRRRLPAGNRVAACGGGLFGAAGVCGSGIVHGRGSIHASADGFHEFASERS